MATSEKKTPEQVQFDQALELLVETRDAMLNILKDKELLRINFKTKFDQMINQLGMLGGGKGQRAIHHSAAPEFEPVTEFFGEPIKKAEKIDKEQLTPKEDERARFAEKVNLLEKEFPNLTDEQILESYGKIDAIVLRGVAKRAGVEDFKTADINVDFISMVRQGLAANATDQTTRERLQKQIDEEAAKNKGKKDDEDLTA